MENTEYFLLSIIWFSSHCLILLSIAIMLTLIVRRIKLEHNLKYTIQRKQELTRYFYAALKSPIVLSKNSLPLITQKDLKIIFRIAIDMLRTLRGDEINKIISVLFLWDLPPYLKILLVAGTKGERIQVITLLGHFSDDESLAILLENSKNSDIYIQLAALRGLALRGAINYIPQIIINLTRSDQTNYLMLSDILRRFGDSAVPSLLDLVRSEAKSEIRIAGLLALGSISALQSVDRLIPLTNDPDMNVRAQAIAVLGKIGAEQSAQAIAACLEDAHVPVRIQAAKALGGLQVLDTLPKLTTRLHDEQWWVRFRAAEAIYFFGNKGIAILKSVGHQDNNAGLIARQVLGEHELIK